MSDDPLKPVPPAVNGYITPRHGRGRLRPFRPGESGNPGGVAGRYQEVVKLAREASPEAMRVMIEIMRDADEETRARLVAIEGIFNRAFGRPREMPEGEGRGPGLNLEGVSEERLSLIIRALELAQKAKRAQGEGGE